jgi:RNA polymerase sigma-70 factor, ECF subfamily
VPDALVTPDSADPAVIVAARERLRLALIASLQYLPPRQRAVLVLRDVLEFPAAEVAVMLGSTVASVKSALQRARARLAEVSPAADEITEPSGPAARVLLDRRVLAVRNLRADGDHGGHRPGLVLRRRPADPGVRVPARPARATLIPRGSTGL